MSSPHPATAAVRSAVRSALADLAPGSLVLVACSGGADSVALAAACAHEQRQADWRAGAVVVDHGLQDGSAGVAAAAAATCRGLGLDPVEVVGVSVTRDAGGLEAAARDARHTAYEEVAGRQGAAVVLLGHTLDDQAEQVLLGLARGSGARSLSGMPSARGLLRRPLLGVTRAQTREACVAEGLSWWDDPMNEDPHYARVRARRAVADLERDLGPGFAAALARTAGQLRDDADALDALADAHLDRAGAAGRPDDPPRPGLRDVGVAELAELPRAVRTRVWRRLLVAAGAPAGQVSARHTDACDALLTDWHGQGPLHVPGDLRVARSGGRVRITPAGRVE